MRRRSVNLAEQQQSAEFRFGQYQRELRSLLSDADGHAQRGQWDDAANKLAAAASSITAMTGVARELRLIYTMSED